MLYSAIVLPHFDYPDSVYDNCTGIDKTWLQSLQSRAARILTGSNIQTHRADMFKDLCRVSLQHRRDMNKCILMYKCLNSLSPCYLTGLFPTSNNIHQYRTCQSNNLHVDKSKLEYYNGSFTITGAKLWNSLPQNFKDILLSNHVKPTFLVYNSFNVIFKKTRVLLSDRLRQPRNTLEWIVSALFGIVAPVVLEKNRGKWWTFNFKMTISVTGSMVQIFVLLVTWINMYMYVCMFLCMCLCVHLCICIYACMWMCGYVWVWLIRKNTVFVLFNL